MGWVGGEGQSPPTSPRVKPILIPWFFLDQNFVSNTFSISFFWLKIISTKKFDQKIFLPKFFPYKTFFKPNILFDQHLFNPILFWPKRFLDQIFVFTKKILG